MERSSVIPLNRLAARIRRGWALFAALGAWLAGSMAAAEAGQFAAFHGALRVGADSPGATPHVAALAASLDAARPAGWIGGLAAFVVTVLCISRGMRWLAPVLGIAAGCAAGAAAGFLAGVSGS